MSEDDSLLPDQTATYQRPTQTVIRRGFGSFWPVLLLAISLNVLLIWQIRLTLTMADQLKKQNEQLAGMLPQAENLETHVTSLLQDLLKVAQNDRQAREIVEKYQIRPSEQPASATPRAGSTSADAPAQP